MLCEAMAILANMVNRTIWERIPRDLRIAAVLFCCAACVGMVYVNNWAGISPTYPDLFGPSVMLAYGKGYINPDLNQIPKLKAFTDTITWFLEDSLPRVDTFSKEDLPEVIPQAPFNTLHDRERYLIYAVALFWRIYGVAWSSLTPLYGILFGTTVAISYGLFRLGMSRFLSVLCAVMFMTSPIHLEYLPCLRDYSKAPFILGALFITGYIASHTMDRRSLMAWAAGCGVLLGFGTGFRLDVLICVIPFLLVLLFFLPRSSQTTFLSRLSAVACFLIVLLVTSWPVFSKLGSGGNKCHPAIMGFMLPFSERLGVGDTPYEFGQRGRDAEVFVLVNTSARRDNPTLDRFLIHGTPDYEKAADRYTFQLAKTFPVDIMTRACVATVRILDELRAGPSHVGPRRLANQFLVALYKVRLHVEQYLFSHMRYVAALVLCAIAWRNLSLAFTVFGLVLYYAGYSAVQFGSRHYFHLEVIPLWFGGVFWSGLLSLGCAEQRNTIWESLRLMVTQDHVYRSRSLHRVGIFIVGCVLIVAVQMGLLRYYQDRQVHALFQSYQHAEWEPVELKTTPHSETSTLIQGMKGQGKDQLPWMPGTDGFEMEWLMAEFTAAEHDVRVDARYLSSDPESDLSWETRLPLSQQRPWRDGDVLRIFFPVYYGSWKQAGPEWAVFHGLEIANADLPSLKGVYRNKSPMQFPVLLRTILPPWWETLPRCQVLTR